MAGNPRNTAHHLLFGLIASLMVFLAVKLLLFQQSRGAEMAAMAERQERMTIPIPARPGNILANGYRKPVDMATSQQVPSVFVDPLCIRDEELTKVSDCMAGLLKTSTEELHARLLANRNRRFLWLARQVDEDVAKAVTELDLPGVGIIQEWRREYPNGSLAAHVIGFAGIDPARPDGALVGLEGMERYASEYLRAKDGQRVVETDVARRALRSLPDQFIAPQDGNHVQLTLDVNIQKYLEDALTKAVEEYLAESGVGVVVDPRTGEVLAVANYPTFDLTAFGKYTADERRNRAITDPYEPGSIFKPYVAVLALEEGFVRLGQKFDCHNGVYRCQSGRILRDASSHGLMSFEEVVYFSSNIGMAQIGERAGNAKLHEWITRFGFGEKSGVELNGEDRGLVNPLSRWNSWSTPSVPMGQEVGVTALQMAMGFAALANDGMLLKPRLIRAVYSPDGAVIYDNTQVVTRRQVVKPEVNRIFVDQVLAKVPTDGTARRFGRLDGWTSFGKTGTAEIASGGGYEDGAYTASYVAAAPVKEPRLVCLVSVRKPARGKAYYGGTVAAPAVKSVLEKSLAYLGVPKDDLNPAKPSPAAHAGH